METRNRSSSGQFTERVFSEREIVLPTVTGPAESCEVALVQIRISEVLAPNFVEAASVRAVQEQSSPSYIYSPKTPSVTSRSQWVEVERSREPKP